VPVAQFQRWQFEKYQFLYTAQSMATASELRQILKEDASGNNTYDHLVEVLMKILIDRPKDVYGSLEQLSFAVKANPLNPDPLVGKPLPPSSAEVCLYKSWFFTQSES
jgi:hypothetical protein